MTSRSPVRLTLESTLTDADALRAMGRMYLPDDDIGNRWALDRFTWIPSDANLAALPFPLAPDTDEISAGLEDDPAGGPSAYYAQVVLTGVPEEVNPGGDGLGTIAGTIASMDLRINRKRITVDLALTRRLPRPYDDTTALSVTWADLATDFPAVTYDDVHPDLTWYDLRTVHP